MPVVGFQIDRVQQVIREMENSPFTFHLTGSRFFGHATDQSDWDFFVEDSPGLDEWLTANGFITERLQREQRQQNLIDELGFGSQEHIQLEHDKYDDQSLIDQKDREAIWVARNCAVHIQIVKSALDKAAVQNYIFVWYRHSLKEMSKINQKHLWQFAFDCYTAGRNSVTS